MRKHSPMGRKLKDTVADAARSKHKGLQRRAGDAAGAAERCDQLCDMFQATLDSIAEGRTETGTETGTETEAPVKTGVSIEGEDSILDEDTEDGTENGVKYSRSPKDYQKSPLGVEKRHTFDLYTKAHNQAMAWAAREDINVRDRALVFYAGKWYIIEKFDDMDYGYLVMNQLSQKNMDSMLNSWR